jgi:hypothetical protein
MEEEGIRRVAARQDEKMDNTPELKVPLTDN